MASPTEENYLKALFNLADEKGKISVSELSKILQISTPTANSMVKNLHEQGLVHYQKYKPLSLTVKGKKEAALIIRKHRLTEMYLVEKMGFGWEKVHEIAEQIEHIKSAEFFDRMDELLEHPTVDPHGSPIPDKTGRVEWKSYQKLTDCKPGETVKLAAITHSSTDFLKFLSDKKLRLGISIKVEYVETFDGSMHVTYLKNQRQVLSALVCEKLLIQV